MRKGALLAAGVGCIVLGWLFRANASEALKVGDRAPDFSLQDQTGKTVRLGDFRGKQSVVLAFYVKAFTPS